MNCFPCFQYSQKHDEDIHYAPVAQPRVGRAFSPQHTGHTPIAAPSTEPRGNSYHNNDANSLDIEAEQFTFRELATATKNFRQECFLGECGLGRIYKGTLQSSGRVVTVKRLDKNSTHGNKEFLMEVLMLSQLRHSNLLNLVGYCADGEQRLLVYEYMPMGSVKQHLLDLDEEKKPLEWATRMKIGCGIAQGIEYLHKANPPVLYRDLRCSNVMLDEDFNSKLSDHGLAKLGGSNRSHVTAMGGYGYCAPEYEKHGELTVKSDVYNFGVVLLELITGRGAVDISKQADEENLVKWAQPIFRDPKRYPEMADPRLGNSFPVRSLNQAVGVAAMCLQDEPDVRPLIGDVVAALSSLSLIPLDNVHVPVSKSKKKAPSRKQTRKASRRDIDNQSDYSDDSSDYSWSDYSEESDRYEYEHKDAHVDEEIGYRQKHHDQKDASMDEEVNYRENMYDKKDVSTDEEIICDENQYVQTDARMNEEIDYRENHYDRKDVSTDEESDYDENWNKQKDARIDKKIGYHKNHYDHKDVSTDEESDYVENQNKQKDVRIDEKIGYHKNDHKDVSTNEESDYDENQNKQKDVRMDEKVGYRKNQYDCKDVSTDEESDYDEKQYEREYACMDEEIGYNHQNQNEQKYSSDHNKNQYEQKDACMDKEIGYSENQNEHKDAHRDEEHDYNYNKNNHYEQKHCMDEEIGSDYDSESSESLESSESSHEDINPSSRQSSRNRSACVGSKGRKDMILKDENIGSCSSKSSNVELDNESVYAKSQSIGSSYSWGSSSIGRSGNGSVRSGHQSP